MPSPSSTHSRDSSSPTTSKSSKWRDPKFLKQIRGGSSNTRYSSPNDPSHSTQTHSHSQKSPARRESITITRTTSYAKDEKNPGSQQLNGTGTTIPRRPSVSRGVSSTEYGGQGHPMSRQVSYSGSGTGSPHGDHRHGLHPYYSGIPLSRQASNSSQQPSASSYANGESRPSISRHNSCSKHPNCKMDDSSGKYTLHVFSAPRWEAGEPSIDRNSRTRSRAREHEDNSPPSRRSHDHRGRSSSRVSARYSPRDREYEYGRGVEERTSRRRGDSRGPNYQLPNGTYDSPPSHTPPSRPSIDHRRSSSQAPNTDARANGYDRGYTRRFSIENFNPHTMDLIRFRRDGGGIETNIRERFDVRPKWVYGSTTDMLRTSPNHYPIRTPDHNLVWRSKCPHTDGSNRPEECKILHTNLDPSSISITPIADTDHTNYSICLMSPHHPSIRGAELNYDTSSNTLEAKVRAVENIQQDMANRFIEWSNTPNGRQRLDLENLFMAGCDSWMSRKDRLNRYKLEINGTSNNTIINGNGHFTTTAKISVNPIIKGFKGLSTGLENLSKGLEQITSTITTRNTSPTPSPGFMILDGLDRVTAGFEEEVTKNFEDTKSLAVVNMTELLREKITKSVQPTQFSSHPQSIVKGNSSKVRFNLADERHLKDTLGNSLPSTASVINNTTAPPPGSGSGSAVGRAAVLATRTDESSRFFKDNFRTIRQSIADLRKIKWDNTDRDKENILGVLGKDLDKVHHQMVENQIAVDSLKESVQKSQNGWIDKIDRELEDIQREEERLKVFRNILLS